MFKHEKALFHPVGVERPNPQYAALLQPGLRHHQSGEDVFLHVQPWLQRLRRERGQRPQIFQV